VEIKLTPKMAAYDLDLRPKGATPPTSQRTSATDSSQLMMKRPTLDDILADRSPAPWTFKAFDRYCQNNLCSENLHFVLDAGMYTKVYTEWKDAYPEDTPEAAQDPRMAQLLSLWRRLIREYITRNAPREVNLMASVRDVLANIKESDIPPDCKILRQSVATVRELIQESILLQFLNERLPQTHSDENLTLRSSTAERPTAGELRSKSSAAHIPSAAAPNAASMPGGKSSGTTFHKRSISTNAGPSSAYALNTGRPRSTYSNKDGKGGIDDSHLSAAILSPSGTPQQRRMSPFSKEVKEISTWKKISSKLTGGLKKKPSGTMKRGDDSVFEEDD
jgi:hypothetical protein